MSEKEIIEKVNKDYLEIVNSKEYRLGNALFSVINGLKSGQMQGIRDGIRALWQGVRIQRYNSKVERYKKVQHDGEKEKIAVYAALFGRYDKVYEPVVTDERCDYYIFTDQEIDGKSHWKKLRLSKEEQDFVDSLTDTEKNRYFKMLGYRKFSDYKYSIYIDINLEVYGDITKFIVYTDNSFGLALYNHPARDCIYNEAEVCIILGKAKRRNIRRQMKKYEYMGMPRHYGMCECGVIVRNNRNENCFKLMESWWNEFRKSSVKRDQLILPFVLWKCHIKIDEIGCLGESIANDGKFQVKSHFVRDSQ